MATYRLPAATGSGYTLMGSPTVLATIRLTGRELRELAARLLDVAPDGTETLVDRQLYRPQVGTARQVFQLHPVRATSFARRPRRRSSSYSPKDAGGGA